MVLKVVAMIQHMDNRCYNILKSCYICYDELSIFTWFQGLGYTWDWICLKVWESAASWTASLISIILKKNRITRKVLLIVKLRPGKRLKTGMVIIYINIAKKYSTNYLSQQFRFWDRFFLINIHTFKLQLRRNY